MAALIKKMDSTSDPLGQKLSIRIYPKKYEGEKMEYETNKEIFCKDTGEILKAGDTVSIKYKTGGGSGGCKITKITDTGFHFNQGTGRDKSAQYKDIEEMYLENVRKGGLAVQNV